MHKAKSHTRLWLLVSLIVQRQHSFSTRVRFFFRTCPANPLTARARLHRPAFVRAPPAPTAPSRREPQRDRKEASRITKMGRRSSVLARASGPRSHAHPQAPQHAAHLLEVLPRLRQLLQQLLLLLLVLPLHHRQHLLHPLFVHGGVALLP